MINYLITLQKFLLLLTTTKKKVGNGSPRDVVYHEQVTDTLQCDPFNECSLANEEEQTIQVSFSASITPAQWYAPPPIRAPFSCSFPISPSI